MRQRVWMPIYRHAALGSMNVWICSSSLRHRKILVRKGTTYKLVRKVFQNRSTFTL